MPIRRIFFSRISLDASIGILDHERTSTQPLHIDAEMEVDIACKVDDNDIHSVLDYRALRELVVRQCTSGHVNLLESLIEQLARRLLLDFPSIRMVKLRISKPMAFSDCAAVGIEYQLERSS